MIAKVSGQLGKFDLANARVDFDLLEKMHLEKILSAEFESGCFG